MNRRCPCCQLPVQVLGLAVMASSDDGRLHGVVGICLRCHQYASGLPQDSRRRRLERAADRALAYPWRYLCTLYLDRDQAILAHALLIHPGHTVAMLGVLGWADADPAAREAVVRFSRVGLWGIYPRRLPDLQHHQGGPERNRCETVLTTTSSARCVQNT